MAGNPFYEISTAYPTMEKYYGLLSGMAYTLPFSICSLSIAMLDGGFNRKKLLTGLSVAAGITMLLMGNVQSLAVLAAMRVCHAAFNSTIQPLIYSLTADYFPRNQRGMANAIL